MSRDRNNEIEVQVTATVTLDDIVSNCDLEDVLEAYDCDRNTVETVCEWVVQGGTLPLRELAEHEEVVDAIRELVASDPDKWYPPRAPSPPAFVPPGLTGIARDMSYEWTADGALVAVGLHLDGKYLVRMRAHSGDAALVQDYVAPTFYAAGELVSALLMARAWARHANALQRGTEDVAVVGQS